MRQLLSVVLALSPTLVCASEGDVLALNFEIGSDASETIQIFAPVTRSDDFTPIILASLDPQALEDRANTLGITLSDPAIRLARVAPMSPEERARQEKIKELVAAAFAHDDRSAREALRASNPDLFKELVLGGYVDPPEGEIVTYLQSELKRMGCYRSSVDGDWGPGSRRGAKAYFDTAKLATPDLAPTEGLYRQIVLTGDVACPAPVQATASKPAAKKPTAKKTTTAKKPAVKKPAAKKQTAAKPAPAKPKAVAKPAPAKKKTKVNSRMGVGTTF